MTEMEMFSETRIVSRNAVIDVFQQVRNLFGWRLRGYEDMLNDATEEMLEDIREDYSFEHEAAWFRVDVDNGGLGGTASVTVFGQGEKV